MKEIFSQKFILESTHSKSPEQDLWIAVLSKAAHDAIHTSDWREGKEEIKQCWLCESKGERILKNQAEVDKFIYETYFKKE